MSNSFPSPGNRPLDHLKVAEPREELRKRGLSLKGVKKYLFERLDEAIQGQHAFLGDNEGQGAYPGELSHYGDSLDTSHDKFPHDRDSLDVSCDDDAISCLKDAETTQNTSLTVISASPYAGVSYAARMFMESHKDVDGVPSMEERRENATKPGFGSIAEVAEGKKSVTDPENILIRENNLVEPMVEYDDRAVENVLQLGNQGSRTEAVVRDGVNNETTDPQISFLENTILPSFPGEVGATDSVTASQDGNTNKSLALELADVTLSAPAQNCAVAGVVGSSVEQEISVPEVISPSDVVIPSEGDKDVLSTSVSDDYLNAASPSVLPTVETVVNANDCPMQDVEVFETTVLTSVSFVTCVQEPGKDSDNNGLNIGISASAKEELVEDDTAEVLLQEGGEAMDPPGAAAELPLLKAVQELQVPEPEGIAGRAEHADLIAHKDEQGIEMVEIHKDTPANAAILEIRHAAASEPSHAIKFENIDEIGLSDGDSEDLKEIPKVGIMEDHKLDVRPGPREAQLRVSERAQALEMVKVEQYDNKEVLLQKERCLDRFWPRDYEADQPRDYEHDWFSHHSVRLLGERGQVENRSGQRFREDGRNDLDKTVFKPGDGMNVHTGQKRKHNDGDAKQQETGKRMRRWNSGNQPVMEVAKPLTSVNEIISREVKREETEASPKLTTKLPGPLKPAHPAAKPASEANREKRTAPPSTRPPSASLKIERFVRPFTLRAVKDLLAEFGDCVDFWMNQIKTHCYVTFSKVEEAVAAQNGLHDRQWPPSFGTPLIANFVDASEVKLRSDGTFDKTNAPALTTSMGIQNDLSASGAQHGRANPLAYVSLRQMMQPVNKDPYPPVPTLDDLFRKTKAKPHIYYLPLSDEQVVKKRAVSQNEKTAAQRKNNQWPVNVRPVWSL